MVAKAPTPSSPSRTKPVPRKTKAAANLSIEELLVSRTPLYATRAMENATKAPMNCSAFSNMTKSAPTGLT